MANDPARAVHTGAAVDEDRLRQLLKSPPGLFILFGGERVRQLVQCRDVGDGQACLFVTGDQAIWQRMPVQPELVSGQQADDGVDPEIPDFGEPRIDDSLFDTMFGT